MTTMLALQLLGRIWLIMEHFTENIAILTDTLLLEVGSLIENEVVTPSTLFALNSLIQAVTLHDKVILGLCGFVGGKISTIENLQSNLGKDIAKLSSVGYLDKFIPKEVYRDILYWVGGLSLLPNLSAKTEINHLSVVKDYLSARKLQDIVRKDALENDFGVQEKIAERRAIVCSENSFRAFNQDVLAHGGERISANDLFAVRELAWQAAAGYTLGNVLRIEVYHSLIERPFYGRELREPKGPLALVRQAVDELSIEEAWFTEIDIPPFLGILLTNPVFRVKDVWMMIRDIRETHRLFRKAVTEFKGEWLAAKTIGEQRKLLREHTRAWEALLGKERYMETQKITYILGKAAKTLGKSLLDDATEFDKYGQALRTVGGLVKLWENMQDITPLQDSREILKRHFSQVADPNHWREVRKLVANVNSAVELEGRNI